ncbi:MAG: type IV secretion system DNA-binding domain-containing protein [Patescibacteria group bacterium]
MTNEEVALFAETNFRGERKRFGIKTDDRRRHVYIIGKTGMGKTTTLENLIISDIRAGRGVGVVDPHGDLAEKILDFIPADRINDVVYFNPADLDWPIAFNILESIDPRYKHLVASGMMGVFKKIWPDVWSARMEYILNNTILALLDCPGSTMLGINRMLADRDYRKKVVLKLKDPVVKAFWVDEFAKYNERFATEAIAPIQNKVGQFLSASIVRNIVGQVKSTIDMREIMDSQKIFIMNLAKGRIGEDASALLGNMLVTRIQLAAMGRVDIPESQRKDFYLYVDEFQNFATLSFANILSEARKYRLNLVLAHQYIEQLAEEVAAAVFGNVGTIVAFRIGAADAEVLEKEFAPTFTAEDLVNLTKYDTYMKLMIDGVSSTPFSASGLPPVTGPTDNRDKVIRVSRERYAKPKEIVEEKITRWSGMQAIGTEEKSDEELEAEIKKSIEKKGQEAEDIKSGVGEAKEKKKPEMSQEELETRAITARETFLEKSKVQAVDFLKIFSEESEKREKFDEEQGAKKEVIAPMVIVQPPKVEAKQKEKINIDIKIEQPRPKKPIGEEKRMMVERRKEVVHQKLSAEEEGIPSPLKLDEPEEIKIAHIPENLPNVSLEKKSAPVAALISPSVPPVKREENPPVGEAGKKESEGDKKTFEEKFPYEIVCSACGKSDRVSFNPDPNRPVYCKACLRVEKEKERQAKKKGGGGKNNQPLKINESKSQDKT